MPLIALHHEPTYLTSTHAPWPILVMRVGCARARAVATTMCPPGDPELNVRNSVRPGPACSGTPPSPLHHQRQGQSARTTDSAIPIAAQPESRVYEHHPETSRRHAGPEHRPAGPGLNCSSGPALHRTDPRPGRVWSTSQPSNRLRRASLVSPLAASLRGARRE